MIYFVLRLATTDFFGFFFSHLILSNLSKYSGVAEQSLRFRLIPTAFPFNDNGLFNLIVCGYDRANPVHFELSLWPGKLAGPNVPTGPEVGIAGLASIPVTETGVHGEVDFHLFFATKHLFRADGFMSGNFLPFGCGPVILLDRIGIAFVLGDRLAFTGGSFEQLAWAFGIFFSWIHFTFLSVRY